MEDFLDRPLTVDTIKKQNLRRWGQALTALTLVIFLVLCARWFFQPSIARSEIRTAKTKVGTIKASVKASGVIVPLAEETVNSELDSRIVKLFAQPGQYLTAGTPIMELEKRGVKLAIAKLEEKIALKDSQIEAANLELVKSINDINSRAALLTVDLESRQARESRLAQLLNQGAAAEQDLLEAKLSVKRSRIELNQLEQSKQDLQSALNAKVEALKLEKSILQQELKEELHLLAMTVIKAPRDGVLSWVKNEEGVSVIKGESLAKVSSNDEFRIKASLSDYYASQLIPGMPTEVFYKGEKLEGRLSSLLPTIENGVMNVFINLQPSVDVQLRNNLRVEVQFVIEELSNVTTLAKGPFVKGSGIQQVFVVRDGSAVKTQVKLGVSGRDEFEVVEGLSLGDEVIISDVSNYMHLEKIEIN